MENTKLYILILTPFESDPEECNAIQLCYINTSVFRTKEEALKALDHQMKKARAIIESTYGDNADIEETKSENEEVNNGNIINAKIIYSTFDGVNSYSWAIREATLGENCEIGLDDEIEELEENHFLTDKEK